jgi:hypothetical protein
VGLEVAGHVGACGGDGDGGAGSGERFPYAPVGEPDPYQAGELVVGARVRLGPVRAENLVHVRPGGIR